MNSQAVLMRMLVILGIVSLFSLLDAEAARLRRLTTSLLCPLGLPFHRTA
jgi:hypothetical protein